jgi:hypothetical protein
VGLGVAEEDFDDLKDHDWLAPWVLQDILGHEDGQLPSVPMAYEMVHDVRHQEQQAAAVLP